MQAYGLFCRGGISMGHVYINAIFHGQKGIRKLDRLLVDTGATYTILPPPLADEIGVFATPYRTQLTLAHTSRKQLPSASQKSKSKEGVSQWR